MMSTKLPPYRSFSPEIWTAVHEAEDDPDLDLITRLMFTNPVDFIARVHLGGKPQRIALNHYRAVRQFITATGWTQPDTQQSFSFDA